ncbi:MAG TPA: hypothetical protein VHX65_13545 [Pirellulales bacterium]|nr:hypothetical protein [Pirellulales bacterium]
MKTIARIGVTTACVAIIAIGILPAAAQVGAANPQAQYQPYQPQNQAAQNPQQYQSAYQNPAGAPAVQPNQSQQYPPQQYQAQPQAPPQQSSIPQQGPGGQSPSQPPPPPFVLSPQEQADLDKVLDDWERQSNQVTTFKCDFKHWVYDPTFLPPKLGPNGELIEQPIKYSTGEIKYASPDKGLIEEEDVWEVTNPGTPAQKSVERKYGEHWACDGKTLSAVDHEKKEVHVTELPPEMQGNLISEGPLPFAFGTKAGPLKARYFLRVITPPNVSGEVWLEIRPRFQRDLTNFVEVQVILRTKDMRPTAIQITHAEIKVPVQSDQGQKIVLGRQREVYQFDEKWLWVPNLLFSDFAPRPIGYKVIKAAAAVPPPTPPTNNSQARRQWPASAGARPY